MSEDAKTWLIASAIVVAMVIASFGIYGLLTESDAEECERTGGTWYEDSRSCGRGSP